MSGIPVVDFTALSVAVPETNLDGEAVKKTAEKLFEAFRTIGFAYLLNTGFPRDLLDEVSSLSDQFFHLPVPLKQRCTYRMEDNHGYVAMEQERVNTDRPGDLKECFNVNPAAFGDSSRWPSAVPNFDEKLVEFFGVCSKLAKRVLLAIAHGLKMKDLEFFDRCHHFSTPGGTTLRLLYYPPLLPSDGSTCTEIKPNQVRLGEHSDYGSITLLFQDNIGGLQAKTREGAWIDAAPVPNAVLINIADLMQRWTSDLLISTPHRVLIPAEEIRQRSSRHSIAFFVHPDAEFVVKCLDGSDKYLPTTDKQYLKERLSATYTF